MSRGLDCQRSSVAALISEKNLKRGPREVSGETPCYSNAGEVRPQELPNRKPLHPTQTSANVLLVDGAAGYVPAMFPLRQCDTVGA